MQLRILHPARAHSDRLQVVGQILPQATLLVFEAVSDLSQLGPLSTEPGTARQAVWPTLLVLASTPVLTRPVIRDLEPMGGTPQ